MSNVFKMSALTCSMLVLSQVAIAQSQANTAQTVYELDPIVITASRAPALASNTPARITVINEQAIQQNPTLNLSDIAQKDASVYIKQNGGIGQGTSLSLRGTNPNHTLLLKNGVRLNTPNSLSPLYPETLDLTDVSRVEVLKGPASVQYGSDAIGGVVHMISQVPEKTGGFVTGVYGENRTYKAIVGADFVAPSGVYAQVRGQRLETDGTRIFNTQAKDNKAPYDQKGYSAKLGYNQQNIDASVAFAQNQGTNNYSDNRGKTNVAERQFNNQLLSANISAKVQPNLTLNGRYSQFKDKQDFVDSNPYHAYTTNDGGDVNAKWQISEQQNLLLGVSHEQQKYADDSIKNQQQKVSSTGYYAQHQYQSDKLNTQVGVRVEDHDKFGTHTVGQSAVRYHFTPATSVYANIGSAFRAPNLSELYYHYENAAWMYYSYGNEKLKPEQSMAYELGLDHQFTDHLSLSLSAYQTKVKNLISSKSVTDPATYSTVATYENIGKAKFVGGELGLKWAKDDVFTTLDYAYNESKNEETKREIAYRPKQTATLTFGYDDGVYGVSTSLNARSEVNADNSANPRKVPSHVTADVNAHWNVSPNVKVFTTLQNITNEQYPTVWNFGNWYINGGRQANVGVTFKY
ncbi:MULTISPECIES: TonB-dependent receptor plug domain-containing protein [unclassified Acinetobacter]|uniref:TonB-dependent receptor plug domain-containing protein n=1 Tax=unclassified Acinetobacter TaxID=196816 RepID=UPI0035B896FA